MESHDTNTMTTTRQQHNKVFWALLGPAHFLLENRKHKLKGERTYEPLVPQLANKMYRVLSNRSLDRVSIVSDLSFEAV